MNKRMPIAILHIRGYLLTALAFSFSLASAQNITRLQDELKKISTDSSLAHALVGFSLRSSDGKTLLQQNAEKSLPPASNLKVVTTATALQVLGEDFRFKTTLEYDGTIDKTGVMDGNIIIRGGGDPTLGVGRAEGTQTLNELMALWSTKIKEAGIRKINGSVIAVTGIFEQNPIPDYWVWTDIGNYYGAGVFGLNINENIYKLVFKPGLKIGDSAVILRTEPAIPNLQFINEVTTAAKGTGDNSYIYGVPYSYSRYVSGTIPAGSDEFVVKGSMPDPAFFSAYALTQKLTQDGVEISKAAGAVTGNYKNNLKVIYELTSPTLKEVAVHTNQSSINLYAECQLKMLGYQVKGEGSTKAGIDVVKEYWKAKGMDLSGFFIYDGSGLSDANAVTPNQFTHLLSLMTKEKPFKAFYNSFPVAGVNGTVARLCKGSKAENNVRAKSGTINKVTCYCGYVTTSKGELLCFSMMVNNYEGKAGQVTKKLERLMVLMAEL